MNFLPNIVTKDGTQIWNNLERVPWIQVASNLTGGVSAADSRQITPSTSSSLWSVMPKGQYANAMWYLPLQPNAKATHFTYSLWAMFPTAADAAAAEALEMDLKDVVPDSSGSKNFDGGQQADFEGGSWRMWNKPSGSWDTTGIACPRWAPATWYPLSYAWRRDAKSVHYSSFMVNGAQAVLSLSYPSVTDTEGALLAVGFQMDANKAGTPYNVILDGITVTAR